ncbi:TPA: hypothetical protein ME755_005607, partial [Klebsiella pneumoniae]|nr:hypothetical protein [Klebsiella pneumoniae]HBW5602337.1 hypothetical protein [Klebsiella pneumoniae]
YCDEKKAEALAKKIEAIKSSETAFSLQRFIDDARKKSSRMTDPLDIVGVFFSELNDGDEELSGVDSN